MNKATQMNRKFFGAIALALALMAGVFATRALYAQARGGMGGMMSMMRDCPMMGAVAQGPDAALKHRQELGLTAAQVQRLESLSQEASPASGQAMERMQALHRDIRQASEGHQFDERAVRAAFERMGALHTDMGVSMLRAQHQTRQILNADQRAKLQELGGGMMGMQGMMGMMENCPMMRGGMMGGGMMHGDSSAHRMHHPEQR